MKEPSLLQYLRDIIIFPVTVTVVIPYLICNKQQTFISSNWVTKFAAAIFFAVGLMLFLSSNYLFKTIAKGTLAPWSPKQNLVIVGPYKYCRNPMISGVLFILLSEALFLHSTNILVWCVIFFVMNTFFFIKVEEPHLTKTFGEQYISYKNNVPRWLPRLKPYNQD